MNTTTTSQPPPNHPLDSVHGPEATLFHRVRTWVDVFPWVRLVRVCRVAGGPVWITHTLVVLVVWTLGCGLLVEPHGVSLEQVSASPVWSTAVFTSVAPSDAFIALPPRGLPWFSDVGGGPASSDWKLVLWTILVWLPTAMALLRVGALLTAGRDMPSYAGTFLAVLRRCRGALLVVILPSLIALMFWSIAAGLTWAVARLFGSGQENGTAWAAWVAWLTLPIVLPSTILAAVLVLGGRLAVPLAIAAIMIEPDPDPLDSLSRGYEYTLRRLPQLVLLSLVAFLIAAVVVLGFVGVSYVGLQMEAGFCAASGPLRLCLGALPAAIGVMLMWSMVGGIYLLLRQSAGGQEVEDLSIESEHWKSPKLPSVQRA